MKQLLISFSLLLLLSACGGDATKIRPTSYAHLSGWKEDAHAVPFQMFRESCRVNATRNSAYQSKSEGPVGVREHWRYVCEKAEAAGELDNFTARLFFETNFQPYKVETEQNPTGLVTGYYEPIIRGSTVKKAPYLTPIYGVPQDLGERKPYFSRAEIVNGAIKNRAPVLFYTDDPVTLFFLHVQGSGKVQLPDGSMAGIQYAGQNGYSYTPIGRVLKERGVENMGSMQSIRDWLRTHPREMNEVMNENQSYVFFKKGPGDRAAKGALGIPLTAGRSIAVDDDRAAYGVPTYLDTKVSEYKTGVQQPLRRLFVSQDTGGALKGPHRADLFFGQGTVQEWQAGHQNARAQTYWLLPLGPHEKLPPEGKTVPLAAPEAGLETEIVPAVVPVPVPVEVQAPELEEAPDVEEMTVEGAHE